MTFLFDNQVSYKFANMLRALGVDAKALRDKYPQDIGDIALFQQIAGQHLIWVSADTKQVRRQRELRALKQAGVTAVFFGAFYQKMNFWTQAAWIIKHWPRIEGFTNTATVGSCCEVKHNGRINVFKL